MTISPIGTDDPWSGRPCPECGGPWWPTDIRGLLTYQHRWGCGLDRAELQTQLTDWERGTLFTRRATPIEKHLLTALGYEPVDGSEWEDEDPGQVVDVIWYGPIRRRKFPHLAAPEGSGLPDPNPAPPKEPPAPPKPRGKHPILWRFGEEPKITRRSTKKGGG